MQQYIVKLVRPCMRKILIILRQNWIKYGFETIVVTVGLLGAFALEGWRENRKEEKELLEVYSIIADDLQNDALALDSILPKYKSSIALMLRILTEEVTMEDWINNDSLLVSFWGYPDFQESQRGLDLLKLKITSSGESGMLAGRISGFYNEKLFENRVTRNEVDDFLYDNMKHWMDNSIWLNAAIIDRDRSLLAEYVEDNPYFRNRLSAYLLVFVNHHNNLLEYKEEGTKLAEGINTFLQNKHQAAN